MTYELVLPIVLRGNHLKHAQLYDPKQITAVQEDTFDANQAADDQAENVSNPATSGGGSAGKAETYLAYGYAHGGIVVGTKAGGAQYLCSCHKAKIVSLYFAQLPWSETVLLSLDEHGILCCWGVDKGSCIRKVDLHVPNATVSSS